MVFVTLALVVLADTHGVLWLLGVLKTLPARRMRLFHRFIWIGLLIIIVSGFFVFLDEGSSLIFSPEFWLKMFFVLCLVINAIVIGAHMKIATNSSFSVVPMKERIALFFSGAFSTTCWIGAFVMAQFI
jgi:hypothetical protein